MTAERFFAFARARHQILLDRAAGLPRPWTDDAILDTYRFTNVFRELDRVTLWVDKHVRGPASSLEPWRQVLAVVLARTFNRTETLERIFCQGSLPISGYNDPIGWAYVQGNVMVRDVEGVLRSAIPRGPWVTGSYIVKTPDGMDKLAGALWIVQRARETLPDLAADRSFACSMQSLHADLCRLPFLGGFSAYEIVSDLRWMPLGRDWPDIDTWAHAGPGAVRGLNRVHGRPVGKGLNQRQALAEMRCLLDLSRISTNWPQTINDDLGHFWLTGRGRFVGIPGDWPAWEMREIEHTLCEFDKYERARLGQGKPRGRFR